MESTNALKIVTLNLPGLDGTFYISAQLHLQHDPAEVPHLRYYSREPLDPPGPDRSAESRKHHAILSTGSGAKQAVNLWVYAANHILGALGGEGVLSKISIHTTESETSILELTRDVILPSANAGTPLRIILHSGDGGIVDLVNGLSAQERSEKYVAPQVVILPLGTANALYHSINAGKGNLWGLQALASTTSKPLPTFTATFSPGARLLTNEGREEEQLPKDAEGNGILHGAVVASWGMHASLVADSDTTEYRKFGIDRFKMAAKEALYPSDGSPPHAYQGKLSVLTEGQWKEVQEEEHTYVLVSLVSNLEQTFCISPASKPLDGSMHFVHFGPRSGDEVMRIMGLAYQGGKHVEEEDVRYESIDGLRIEFRGAEEEERWRRVCIDGKIVRVEADGWVEVRKSQGKGVLDVVVVE
jgi:diacylglycerol kinase family enzyme